MSNKKDEKIAKLKKKNKKLKQKVSTLRYKLYIARNVPIVKTRKKDTCISCSGEGGELVFWPILGYIRKICSSCGGKGKK